MVNQSRQTKPENHFKAFFVVLGIFLSVLIAVYHTFPPTPSALDEPLTSFSSARAMAHVREIGKSPHPTGTHENEEVRRYLVGQLQRLGFAPEIQSAQVVVPRKRIAGQVQNVLVKVSGNKASSKALLLVAHYDSVHTGPGAADDGASVAAILETLRAVKSVLPLHNDLICLFTDGEEAGLLGAEAFVKQHAWAKHVGLVLNFEYRGNRGAFMMFETSQGNGKLVAGLAEAVPFVLANSLMYEVYKRLPNDTDLTVFKQAGIPAMNFAAIEGLTHYHTQLDRPEALAQTSLQHEGDIMLAMVKHFGNMPLDSLKSDDQVYFDLLGPGLVHYPTSWLLPLNGVLLLLFAAVTTRAIKSACLRPSRIMAGALLFLMMVFGLSLLSHLLWLAILQLHHEYRSFHQGDIYNSHWYLLAFVLTNIAFFLRLQNYVEAWFKPFEFAFGVSLVWLSATILLSCWLPGASYLFYWPLFSLLTAIGILFFLGKQNRTGWMLLLVYIGSILGILLFAPLIKGLFVALTPHMIAVDVVCLTLLLGLLSMLLDNIKTIRNWGSLLLVLGFACFAAGSYTSGFDAAHPRQYSLFYASVPQEDEAYWLSTDEKPIPWGPIAFKKATAKNQFLEFLGDSHSVVWASPAVLSALPAPEIEILEDAVIAEARRVKIWVKSSRRAPKLKVALEGVGVITSKVAGETYSNASEGRWSLDAVGFNDEGLPFEFTLNPNRSFNIKIIDLSYKLPYNYAFKIPSSFINNPSEFSGTTVIVTARQFPYR